MHQTTALRAPVPDYVPSRVFGNRHAMNLTLLVPRRRGALRRSLAVRVPIAPAGDGLDAGGSVLVQVTRARPAGGPVLVVVPGLTGSACSTYVVGLARKAVERGLGVVRFNARGCGGTEALAAPLSHCGLTRDLAEVCRFAVAGLGFERVHLAGFSMGGNLALKLAGEWGTAAPVPLASVAVVSPAIAVARCGEHIDAEPSLAPYRRRFVSALRAMLRRHARAFGRPVDAERLRRVRTIRDFDALYTAPVWGFADVDDYWRRSSALGALARLAVPTLAIAAADDVLVPFDSLAPLRALDPELVRFLATDRGGHCSFLARTARPRGAAARDPDRRWAENRVLEFVMRMENDR
ncbi:MAG: alpha/beta fold hydrolase [Planctomycetes bacterium]|nr:alpha/beta fold hydrolase [Planctomycetota bacterium]